MRNLNVAILAWSVCGLVSVASADVINVSVAYDLANGYYRDTTIISASALSSNGANGSMTVGENIDGSNAKPFIPFVLTAEQKSLIAQPGTSIKLAVTVSGQTNNTNLAVDVWGLGSRGDNATASTADYNAGSLAATSIVSGGNLPVLTYFSVDVTDFVKQQAADNNVIAFLLALSAPESKDGTARSISFASTDHAGNYGPLLVIETASIPEPASLATLFVAGVGMIARRRRL